MKTDPARITHLNQYVVPTNGQCIVYWMQNDQRARDNWALIYAIERANELKLPLLVAFFVWPTGCDPQARQYDFMLRGLTEVAGELRSQGIGFVMRHEDPTAGLVALATELEAGLVVTDRSPLALGRGRRSRVATKLSIPLVQIEAHYVIPPEVVSNKAFYAAYHARPKQKALYERFLTDYPRVSMNVKWDQNAQINSRRHGNDVGGLDDQDPTTILEMLNLGMEAGVLAVPSGPKAAISRWHEFIDSGMHTYESQRNDPTQDATSGLSAYLHFGQISAQRIAYDLLNSSEADTHPEGVGAFMNELITWRELAVNFTTYTPNYRNWEAVPTWAQKSLEMHADDPRDFIYDLATFEAGTTHDPLWNAAQQEMMKSGRMHGYMRMYWAKKILEWSETPQQAIKIAIFLNDRYELDGRDPNGYAGVLWAIGGLHDRPWFDRPIYGQVRYMSAGGAKGKFDVQAYIDRWIH